MANVLHSLRRFFAQPAVREFLLWCLPALLVGLALRVVLLAQLPYAVYHDDTGDLLATPYNWLAAPVRSWEIAGKKTFLVPTIYTVLATLKIPIMLAVPFCQHIAGLVMILMVGLLCRLWFTFWRWLILPVTLLIAVDPALLWYEHLLMPETAYVFFTTMLAVAGTLYALQQSNGRFAFLCAALFLEAGSRPEGKLLFGFAFFVLVLIHWGKWRALSRPFLILLVVAAGTFYVTRTGQAGLLLYTSVARMTPTQLRCAPGFDAYIAPIRASLQKRWADTLSFPKVQDRRDIAAAVDTYLKNEGRAYFVPKVKSKGKAKPAKEALKEHDPSHEDINDFCLKLAKETCLKNFFNLPAYFYQKFRSTTKEPTYQWLDKNWVFDRQADAFNGNHNVSYPLARHLAGDDVGSEGAYAAFLQKHYQVIGWFNQLAAAWNDAIYTIRLLDEQRPNPGGGKPLIVRRLPVFYLLGGLGLLMMMFRRGVLLRFHIAWGLTLMALLYTIVLTANVRGRFRFGFEPYWYLYIAAILDTLAYWLFWKHRAAPAVTAAPLDEPAAATSLPRPV